MEAIRTIIKRNNLSTIQIPESFGDMVEVIIIPKMELHMTDSRIFAELQQKNGFAENVLSQECEDVWNEL